MSWTAHQAITGIWWRSKVRVSSPLRRLDTVCFTLCRIMFSINEVWGRICIHYTTYTRLSWFSGLSQRPCSTAFAFVSVRGVVPTAVIYLYIYIYIGSSMHIYLHYTTYTWIVLFFFTIYFPTQFTPPPRPHGVIVINPNGITCFICVYDIANT